MVATTVLGCFSGCPATGKNADYASAKDSKFAVALASVAARSRNAVSKSQVKLAMEERKHMNQIVYIVGAVVIVIALLSFIGLR